VQPFFGSLSHLDSPQHLFLDRELAEVLDAREFATSKVRTALTGILVGRLRGPPPPPLQMRGLAHDGQAPTLPQLDLGTDKQRPYPGRPSASFQGQARLSPIEDHSTTHESLAPSGLFPNLPAQAQSPPTPLDGRPSHHYQGPATPPTFHASGPAPGQSLAESVMVPPSAIQRLPDSVRTQTPPGPAPTASRKLSPPKRGDTLPVNLSHSRMPTKVDNPQVLVNNGLIHSSPVEMLSPLSVTNLINRSTASLNISGAPLGLPTIRSTSVPPEASTSSTPTGSWQPPSGPPPGASGLGMPPPPNVSLTNNVPPAPPLNIAPPVSSYARFSAKRYSNSHLFLLQPGPPPSENVSSRPWSQADTRKQDASHDYQFQLLNEAAVSYMQQLDDEDETPAQPQGRLPPRLAALGASQNIATTNGVYSPTNGARTQNATASGSGAGKPSAAVSPAADNKMTHFDQTLSSPSSYPTTPNSQAHRQVSTSSSQPMSQQQRPQEYDEGTFDAAGALAALSFAEAPPESVKPQYPLPPPVPNEEDGPSEGESDTPSGTHGRSSFATGSKAAQRKAKAQAHQAATQEALHRPGRPNGKKAGKKPGGAWGSSDEEEDEEEEDEEDEEEQPLPRSNNRTPSNLDHVRSPSHAEHGQSSIASPQPRQYYNQSSQPSMADYIPYSPAHSDGVHVQHHQQQQQRAARMLPQPPDMASRGQSPYQHQESSRQSSGTDHRRHLDPHDDPRGRGMYDQPRSLSPNRPPPPQLAGGPSRPMWSTVLDPSHERKTANEKTFVTLEPNETMTKAFTPQGLLQAGIQDRQDRSAKRQEELARESGASLINVPHKPPPPQTGLVGAITAHERDRKREGGVGAALTERERERRMAEERQRKFDEIQRQQLDQMSHNGHGGPGSAMELYGPAGGYPMMNPMMMNPMMWGMNPMMMMGGYGMPPMGMGGMPGVPGVQQMNPQQIWAAQQAAMQAYQNAMVTFSQAGSDAGQGDGGGGDTTAAGGQSTMPAGWGGMGMMPGMMPGYGMGMASAPGSAFLHPGGPQGMNMSSSAGDGARISAAFSNSNSPNLSPARHDSPRGGTPQVQ
jgi:CCR4-NOT transcriptional complex subunit CAF120